MVFKRKKKISDPVNLPNPGIMVLLESLPELDFDAIRGRIAKAEKLKLLPKIEAMVEKEPRQETLLSAFEVSFDSHEIRLVVIDKPLPEPVYKDIVGLSMWPDEVQSKMNGHGAHAVLMHNGGGANPFEKLLALYKLGAALVEPFYIRGAINEPCLSCISDNMLLSFLDTAALKSTRNTPPPFAFQGFIQIEQGLWATRGHQMFGLPDFAMKVSDNLSPIDMMTMFGSIFMYANISGMQIADGHTMQAANDRYLKFNKFEHAMWLGDQQLLMVTQISADKINK